MHAPRAVSAILLLFALTAPSAGQGLYLGPQPANPQPANPRPRPHHQAPRRPHRPLVRVTELRVKAEIVDGVATTELRQVFRNDGPRVAEGTWILPLPNGAAADRFTMTVGGVETAGEILDANKARRIYEQIVRQQRDPGLLEYTGSGCLRARIFPIPAHGEVPVLVRYRQVLPATGALHAWSYPLRAAGGGGMAPERMSLEVHVRSTTPLRNVYSPLPGVAIRTIGEHEARVSYEGASGRLPERDPAVFYGLSEEEFGLHLLTHRASSHGAGTFLMLLSPKQEWADTDRIRKEITFVLDTSGSMKGPKIAQARDALRFFIRSLRPSDRFNVVPFSTEARPFFAQPMAADEAHREVALAKVDAIEARGGTNIEDALRAALQPPAAPGGSDGGDAVSILLFLTDGLPTVGNTDIEQLLAAARQRNSHGARVFAFGVGNDVNTRLLDKLAEEGRGDRDYVREDESIEVKTGALLAKVSHPVMTDVEILCDGITGFDVFPRRTPDLFKGSRLLVVGRYKGSGHHAVRLRGKVRGVRREFVFDATFPARATEHDFVPALWAERKVAYLLDQIRLNGRQPELVAEVTRLGKEFGIATPYTSHLILEEGMRVSRARGVRAEPGRDAYLGDDRAHERVRNDLARAGALPSLAAPAADQEVAEELLARVAGEAPKEAKKAQREMSDLWDGDAVGKGAVERSVQLRQMSAGAPLSSPSPQAPTQSAARLVSRRVAGRTFHLAGGVWVDGGYREAMRDQVRKVAAFSDDYFALLREHPEVARYLAFSARILLLVDGAPIEIE